MPRHPIARLRNPGKGQNWGERPGLSFFPAGTHCRDTAPGGAERILQPLCAIIKEHFRPQSQKVNDALSRDAARRPLAAGTNGAGDGAVDRGGGSCVELF